MSFAQYTLAVRLRPAPNPPTDTEIEQAEARVGVYPPSFRRLVRTRGLFVLYCPAEPTTTFRAWPLADHQTALARAASELGSAGTVEAVGAVLGLSSEVVAVLEQIVLVGCEHVDSYVGFDLRTRDAKTQEAVFVSWSMNAAAIERLAACPGRSQSAIRGFGAWIESFPSRCRRREAPARPQRQDRGECATSD